VSPCADATLADDVDGMLETSAGRVLSNDGALSAHKGEFRVD
jgi:hypothetical protein